MDFATATPAGAYEAGDGACPPEAVVRGSPGEPGPFDIVMQTAQLWRTVTQVSVGVGGMRKQGAVPTAREPKAELERIFISDTESLILITGIARLDFNSFDIC